MHFFNSKNRTWINYRNLQTNILPWVLCILFPEMPQVQFYLHLAVDISAWKFLRIGLIKEFKNLFWLLGDHYDIQVLYFHKSKFLFEKVSIVEIFFGFEQRRFDHFVSIVSLNSIDFLRNMCKRKLGRCQHFKNFNFDLKLSLHSLFEI